MSHEHSIHVFINKQKYKLEHAVQTGSALNNCAGIPLSDVLFLQRPGDDEVIGNDAKVTLKNGDHLHSQPPADYGLGPAPTRRGGFGRGTCCRSCRERGLVVPRDLRLQASPPASSRIPWTCWSSCRPDFRTQRPTCSGSSRIRRQR